MTRYLVVLNTQFDRAKAINFIRKAPDGTRVELKAAKRSLAQNDLLWSRLTDIATQKTHNGRKYTSDQWKCLLLSACGREVQFIPSLDGKTFLPWGQSSSDLSKQEMNDLLSFMEAWGAENGVVFSDVPPTALDYAACP